MLPVTFGALDGEASWLQPVEDTAAADGSSSRQPVGPHRLSGSHPDETTRPALFTALRTGFADDLLHRAFDAIRDLRARRRAMRARDPAGDGRGLGKLLVVAPDQEQARRYGGVLRRWVPKQQGDVVRLAISDQPGAHEALAAFRLLAHPAVLVSTDAGIAPLGVTNSPPFLMPSWLPCPALPPCP